jgi:hypothetical protein
MFFICTKIVFKALRIDRVTGSLYNHYFIFLKNSEFLFDAHLVAVDEAGHWEWQLGFCGKIIIK